ncbi:MAG: Z1 domain-containing protein [Bacteroidales bacterium]|uniref:Z1 domain-containing protein n=1 Tax=Porphyromonas sp. TaxID=1924944 RepID=UPI002978EF14|nr:Z1 domain-containing protein [Porphyromonas sp.]MDD7438196.1 Z1 domain-containing protein [Bacteroidales bacterium]MDY3066843.1 Z1 domain-containing protein [Porphyromonas sp.]
MKMKINKNSNAFSPSVGLVFNKFLQSKDFLSPRGKMLLEKETVDILSQCLPPNFSGGVEGVRTTNLVVGYVQSGKTLSFTALSALAKDNGYRIIIYFAGVTNNLLEQTKQRLRKDLDFPGIKIYNPSDAVFRNSFSRVMSMDDSLILLPILKHRKYISDLALFFKRQNLDGLGILIIDDEADQASLNTQAKKRSEISKTYESIEKLRSSIGTHSYLQYTATPQAPLLIDIMDNLSPNKHYVLEAGEGYTGGLVFFKDRYNDLIISIPSDEVFHEKVNDLTEPPQSLISSLMSHLLSVSIIVKHLRKEHFLSMMIHASAKKDVHEKFYLWVNRIIEGWWNMLKCYSIDDFSIIALKREFEGSYNNLARTWSSTEDFPSFESAFSEVENIIADTAVVSLNSDCTNSSIDWRNSSSFILVGGEMLGRGFTVEKLATTYMSRYSLGKSQADTMQQRCRFFGYKENYIDVCRVYLPESVVKQYVDYIEHEEEMRDWLKEEDTLEGVHHQFVLSPSMNPTRKNILANDIKRLDLKLWKRWEYLDPIDNSFEVRAFLQKYQDKMVLWKDYGTEMNNHRWVDIPAKDVIDLLYHYQCSDHALNMERQAIMRLLGGISSEDEDTPLCLIEMGFCGSARKRSCENGKINQLFVGHSNIYPGDSKIKVEDKICLQIHRVKPEGEGERYMLAFYFPPELSKDFVGVVESV